MVDYNHPLAGKTVFYDIEVKRIVTDTKEKIAGYMALSLGVKPEVTVDESKAVITLPMELPRELQKPISDKISELTSVKSVEFKKREEQSPSDPQKQDVSKKTEEQSSSDSQK